MKHVKSDKKIIVVMAVLAFLLFPSLLYFCIAAGTYLAVKNTNNNT